MASHRRTEALALCLALALLLQAGLASAQPGGALTVVIWPDGTSEVRASLVIDTSSAETVLLPGRGADLVSVNDDVSPLRFAVLDEGILIRPSRQDSRYPLEVSYQTTALTSKQGSRWIWALSLGEGIWQGIEQLSVAVRIPQQAMLVSSSEGAVVYSADGMLHVGWRLAPAGNATLAVEYDTPAGAGILPLPGNGGGGLAGVGAALAAAALAAVLLFIAARLLKQRMRGPAPKDVLAALERNERAIMSTLAGQGKEMTQTQLARHTGLSKASVSRAVKRLREKGFVTAKSLGTATLVSLSPGRER